MLKFGALCAASLLLSVSGAPASASALASASLDIVRFTWYKTTGDPVTWGGLGSGSDTRSLSGSEEASIEITRPNNNQVFAVGDVENSSFSVGSLCEGAGCGSAPPEPPAQFAYGDQDRREFYMSGVGSSGVLTAGLTADVSLPGPGVTSDTAGDITSRWSSLSSMRAQRDFDSYFEIEIQAQTLAQQSPDAFQSWAESSLSLQVSFNDDAWLDLRFASVAADAGAEDRTSLSRVYTSGVFSIVSGSSYKVDIVSTATATASTTGQPSEVPILPVPWLILPGLVWLMSHMRFVRNPSRTRAAAILVV